MQIHIIAFLLFCHSFIACQQGQEISPMANLAMPTAPVGQNAATKLNPTATNLIFQSQDEGQTWLDISDGLPEKLDIWASTAADGTAFLGTKNGLYRRKTAATGTTWNKSFYWDQEVGQIFPDKNGTVICSYQAGFFIEIAATGVWMPIFTELRDKTPRILQKTADGFLFVGCDSGLFKSSDAGKTWREVYSDGLVFGVLANNGMLFATAHEGLLRSTDAGETWEKIHSEGGACIETTAIEGGIATINYDGNRRRIRFSDDNGKTWQPIDADLAHSKSIRNLKQVGKFLFCSHEEGVFRSADRGKTWELILASPKDRMYNLSVMNGVLFAVPGNFGC